jgi:hypothetical protein
METTEQIVREAPDIEAYKLGLLKQAKSLSDQPVGVLQFDQTGQPIMETYQYVDAEGNTQTGTRQQRMLPPQLVAEMSGLQKTALEGAQAGIGNYLPYLENAGYTLGDAQTAIGGVMDRALPFQDEAAGLMRTAAANVPGVLGTSTQGTEEAIQRARGITSQAAQALQQAGALGTTAAQQGIAGLAGTTGTFDPASAQGFMSQFDDAAVQQALSDIARQGQIAQQGVAAQAVGAGAFGGSRQAVAEQELGRNILEQQGRTAAQMRQAGFESATQRAQAAFEAQQGRALQAAQLTGGLGAQGAQAGLSAAQAAGQLGLSAEQLAAQTAQQQGQLGIQGQELMGRLGEGIGTLGTQYGQLGLQQGDALGTLGLRQASLGELTQQLGQREQGFLFDMGQKQQAQQQAEIEAARASQLQQLYEPYQRVGFLSDIYKGAPSSQQSITASTAPTASAAQQILGLGTAGLSAYAGASRAGLFG